MYQQYALSHNIEICILKMSITYIMGSACSSDQITQALTVANQIQLRNRLMRFVLNMHAHKNMTLPNFPSFCLDNEFKCFFIKGNLNADLHNP